jgi:hypothetical protein
MKNYATGTIHRGYMQCTGRALVALGLTAAVAHNLHELENRHARPSKHCPDNPLLAEYEQHLLHQPTQLVHGFTTLILEHRAQWEHDWLEQVAEAHDDAADLPAAAQPAPRRGARPSGRTPRRLATSRAAACSPHRSRGRLTQHLEPGWVTWGRWRG